MLSVKPGFHCPLMKRLFSSSSLSAVRVVLSACLRLLIFLPATLILACDSSSSVFRMMYTVQKLNKQGDNIQPCHTSFPILKLSVVPLVVLTCFLIHIQVSQATDKMVWNSHLFKNFPQFVMVPNKQWKVFVQSMKQMFSWNSVAFSMILWMLAV